MLLFADIYCVPLLSAEDFSEWISTINLYSVSVMWLLDFDEEERKDVELIDKDGDITVQEFHDEFIQRIKESQGRYVGCKSKGVYLDMYFPAATRRQNNVVTTLV